MRHRLQQVPRTELARYGLVTIGLSVGIWRSGVLLAIVLGLIGYLISPYVAHPRDAIGYRRRSRQYRTYLAAVASSYGRPVDLGHSSDDRARALAGVITPYRVFVSSTFLDLAAERDRLSKDLFPRLARECERRGAVWAPIDLRWGITDLQQHAGEVARLCLRSVGTRGTTVLGVVGSRYGTCVPIPDDELATLPPAGANEAVLSLTHLELRHAALTDPAKVSIFVMDVPRDGDDAVRLTSMIRELRAAGARIVEGVADADQLVDLAAAEFLGRLDEDVPDDRLGNLVLREISAHRLLEEQYAARPTLNADVLAAAGAHLAAGRVAVVSGAAGSGRSTLMAAWARRWRTEHPDDVVVCRFVGLTASSQSWPQLARSIATEIAVRAGVGLSLPDDDLEVPMALARLVLEVQAERRVVIGIDGLDRMRTLAGTDDTFGRGLGWLPQSGEEVALAFVPMLATDDLDDVERAYDVGIVDVPPLPYVDRLTLVDDSLARVDRLLPAADVSAIVENDCTGNPAFLSLLLDELHKVSSHDALTGTLAELVAATSLAELAEYCLRKREIELGGTRARQVEVLLALLARASVGLTVDELVGLVQLVREGFDPSDFLVLRERLAAFLIESDGAFRIKASLLDVVRAHTSSPALAAEVDHAWLRFFTDPARSLTVRGIALLTDLDDGVAEHLREIVEQPQGLVAVRAAFGPGYPRVLAFVARNTGSRTIELVRAAAAGLEGQSPDIRIGVAEICLDHQLLSEVTEVVAGTPWNELEKDPYLSQRVLALTAKVALRGGDSLDFSEWQFILEHGIARRSANVHLAMSGIAVTLARRGDAFWAAKYFRRALEVAMTCGNLTAVVANSANLALAAAADGASRVHEHLRPQMRTLFDGCVAMGESFGQFQLLMAGLLRRSVTDLHLGDPEGALEGFDALMSVAEPLGQEHHLRLAHAGRAVALSILGRTTEATELAAGAGLALAEAAAILDRELRTVIA